jgi:hypothetical protein
MVDFNLQGQRTRTFKGFVQFQSPDPNNEGGPVVGGSPTVGYYRFKERQSCTINFRFAYAEHYSDSGQKALDPAGYNHSFSLTVKTTADLFDDTWSDVDPADDDMAWQTPSYWIAKANANEPMEIVFVATLQAITGPTGATTEKFIHMKFVLLPEEFSGITYGAGGSQNITIAGSVLSINYIKRSDSAIPT